MNTFEVVIALPAIVFLRFSADNSKPWWDVNMKSTAGHPLILDGQFLVKVFSLRIVFIDSENPSQLYGTIKATNGLNRYDIYYRNRGNYKSTRPDKEVTLTSPGRAISAARKFIINFNFMNKNFLFPENEINRGQIE